MRRRGIPTLYELARSGMSGGGDASTARAVPGLSSAMRSLRIPLGFLWLLGVGVLVVGVIAYAFGYSRGKTAGFNDGVAQRFGQDSAAATARAVQDPLLKPAATPAVETGVTTARAQAPSQNGQATTATNGDPRQKGVNYFVIARPADQIAAEMLAFCRAEGLDAHLVSDHNAGRSRKIIVLPGLASAEARKSPDAQKLEARIKTVGQRWKAKAKGNKDFSDAYLELFR